MATKLTLTESWIYAGKHYGPGEVEIEDDAAAQAIKAKMDAKVASAAPERHVAPESAGVQTDILEKLAAAGFETPELVAAASDDELLAIEGIGPATLKKIRGV